MAGKSPEPHSGTIFKANLKAYDWILGRHIIIVVDGIIAPSIDKAECPKEKELGIQAKEFTEDFLKNSSAIYFSKVQKSLYYQSFLGSIHGDKKSLEWALIDAGLAVKSEDKEKKDWCD